MLLDLAHCQLTLVAVPSGSVRLAVKGIVARGCRAERVTVPSSSTLVTSTITSCMPVLPVLSTASTVISYVLSPAWLWNRLCLLTSVGTS